MSDYKIGELAKLTNLTTRTIRYYEELGLLGTRDGRCQGQTRYFDNNDIERLKKIHQLKGLGLSLEEIAQVIDLYFTDGRILEGKRKVIEILSTHVSSTEKKIIELTAFKKESEENIARIKAIMKEY
ncbi:MerR family transcriptional regulator [Sporomusa termitida]|uniref:CueR: Cu(I)-responsive transcriptional regulator n=1 Tax=Sporomusa termitida TaxID=2377 RepID=A0A517DVK9_9FIRM|nr:MerR family transcriptional regulator [Sporomusa termitida]QDR81306.1 CueR: Cu(I)-responsive transcriptional regulator [Sporomusa termitida]